MNPGDSLSDRATVQSRLTEELRNGKTLRISLDEGRRRAFPSIVYSNAAVSPENR